MPPNEGRRELLRFLLRRLTQPLIFPMILKRVQLLPGERVFYHRNSATIWFTSTLGSWISSQSLIRAYRKEGRGSIDAHRPISHSSRE